MKKGKNVGAPRPKVQPVKKTKANGAKKGKQ